MTGDLVTWLREKIAQDLDLYQLAAKRPRSNKPMLQAYFDRIEAYTAILKVHATYAELYPDDAARYGMSDSRYCVGCGRDDREEWETSDINDCPTLRALALAYQHRDGYREEWRP